MVWVNYNHINEQAPPGVFGGAICMCEACCKKREQPYEKTAIEIMQEAQIGNTGDINETEKHGN